MSQSKKLCKQLGIRPRCINCCEYYPDMTQPENFVKLLECCFSFFEKINIEKKGKMTYIKRFLDTLARHYSDDDLASEEGFINLAKFKKLIRKIEWNY